MPKVTDGLCLAYLDSNKVINVLSRSSLKPVEPTLNVQNAFNKVKHKWSVVVSIMARTPQDELQVVSNQVTLPLKLRKASLATYLAKLHEQLGDEIRYNHPDWVLEDAAWLADPLGGDWPEEDISRALKVLTTDIKNML